ncbi:superinfection immunity protein [Gracilibacillus xinjiangensis]|uniref:Superinfection immunity protein n=1 Tax=Gracilibacillus xinjiangensis TaxID=1193282 RepID=A0ABV8WRP4_9BACI
MEILAIIIATAAMIFLYFTPSILAARKNSNNKITIYLINFFLGWSLFGWLAALYLALQKNNSKVRF